MRTKKKQKCSKDDHQIKRELLSIGLSQGVEYGDKYKCKDCGKIIAYIYHNRSYKEKQK